MRYGVSETRREHILTLVLQEPNVNIDDIRR